MRQRILWLVIGALAGFIGCFLGISWRVQAATAMSQMYAIGAYQMSQDLKACEHPGPAWPKR